MDENLTLANSYALAEKHALWDEAKQSCENKQKNKCRDYSPNRDDSTPKAFTKFTVPIGQILRQLKNEPWFKLLPPMKGDLTKLDQTKYCAFHRGPCHITNGSLKWTQYLKELTKECRYNEYLDKPAAQLVQAAEVDIEPLSKTMQINGIFARSEHSWSITS
ncbi:hypothetical protein ACFXTH_040974 [Malus domestica]